MRERRLNKGTELAVIGIVLMSVAFILILSFFMQGETKTNGNWTIEQTGFLSCEASGINYPFFRYDSSHRKSIKINSTSDDENIKTISLMYVLEYNNEKSIVDSENLNHIAMNENFAKDGLGFDALGLKFSKFSNGLQMSLFINANQIDDKTAKYFMLDKMGDITSTKMQESYEAQGFICQRKNQS